MSYEPVYAFEYTTAEGREQGPRHLPLEGQDHAVLNHVAPSGVDGRELANIPTGEYVGRGNYCMAKEDTCQGRRAKGTKFCMGHLNSQEKAAE